MVGELRRVHHRQAYTRVGDREFEYLDRAASTALLLPMSLHDLDIPVVTHAYVFIDVHLNLDMKFSLGRCPVFLVDALRLVFSLRVP